MSNKVYVNIHNKGTLMGLKTPVYNFPMDAGTYQLLKEMGFMIEIATKKEAPVVKSTSTINTVNIDNKVKVQETVNKEPEVVVTQTKAVQRTFSPDDLKDVYTEEELAKMAKWQLSEILKLRGHYSSRVGQRDSLAPKFDDNKTILTEKVLKTNKVI